LLPAFLKPASAVIVLLPALLEVASAASVLLPAVSELRPAVIVLRPATLELSPAVIFLLPAELELGAAVTVLLFAVYNLDVRLLFLLPTTIFYFRSPVLIDKFIPTYHFNEIHKRLVNASPEQCFLAAKNLDMSPLFITRLLLRLRGLPYKDASFAAFMKSMCFNYLAENPHQEFVIDASKGDLKIYWNFAFDEVSTGETMVTTETRVFCLTKKSKRIFTVYWFFIKPFSGYIRKDFLRMIAKSVER
jgi:hypothetical protein